MKSENLLTSGSSMSSSKDGYVAAQQPINSSATEVPNSTLSKGILECEFSRNFSILTFDYYSRMSGLV